ncbi:MAG TPA: glycosyltransferase [Candidatus Nanoarchaeia archaeon]|nr:glycosyltransferase [Candidatus Nanoarchaeia archaeon]
MIGTIILVLIIFIVVFLQFLYSPLLDFFIGNKILIRKKQVLPVSIIIPAYNEEKYIARKIKNLKELDYPKKKFEIIVVDNGSKDNTVKIAKKLGVKVLTSERGKTNALNMGIKSAKYNIVAMTDADTTLSKNVLRSCVELIHNDVAAVSAFTKVIPKDLYYFEAKNRYHEEDWQLRHKEGMLDTTCSLDGKFIMFNKQHFQEFPKNTICDDFVITLELRKKGFRSVVDPDSIVFEECPSSISEELKQIRRRVGLGLDTVFTKDVISMLFNHGYFGNLILPARRFLSLIVPLFGLYITIYLFIKLNAFIALAIILLGFILLSISMPYTLLQLLGASLGWLDLFLGNINKTTYWQKVKS